MNQPQTPFFRIKEKDLLYVIELLKESLNTNWGSNYIVGYSVKTNSLPWLLTYLKKYDFYAEIVSETEYQLVQTLGFNNQSIIYNGPIKERAAFEAILLEGGYVNFDSSQEPEWIEELSKQYPDREFSVGLRSEERRVGKEC